MRSWMIAFILGVACFWIIPDTWYPTLFFNIFVVTTIILIVAISTVLFWSKKTLFLSLGCIIGFVLSMQQHDLLRNHQTKFDSHSTTVEITGIIQTAPIEYQNFISFRVQLDSIKSQSLHPLWKPSVQLNWYHNNRTNPHLPERGERWLFNVRVKPLHGLRNPGGFDYERWGWSKRIIARGYIDNRQPQNVLMKNQGFLGRWRSLIAENIDSAMPKNSDLAAALLIGDRSRLSEATKQTLQQSGLAHLLAISGLHVGMVAVIGFWISIRLWKFSSKLCLLIPAVDVAVIFSVFLAAIYALLSGWGIPAQRALLMLFIFSLNHLLRIQWRLLDILLLALSILLVINPVTILDSSGWLSFGAVFIIAGLLRFQNKIAEEPLAWSLILKNWVQFSILLWLALLPLSLILFSKIAFLGWLANLIAIPLMSLLIMPLLLFSAFIGLISTKLAQMLLGIADFLLSIVSSISELLSVGGQEFPQAEWYGLILAILLFVWFLPRAIVPSKYLVTLGAILLSFVFLGFSQPTQGARLMVFDVGQGLAVFWEDYSDSNQRPKRLVFDTGYGNQHYQSGKTTWLPYFSTQNIKSIDALVISHKDADHSGGLSLFENKIHAEAVFVGQPLDSTINTKSCHQSAKLIFASTQLSFLKAYQDKGLSIQKNNNQSCIAMLEFKGAKILLPGDIEIAAESRLLNNQLLEQVDVVIAPHHGSNTSSGQNFIDAINPTYSLFSTGYLNRYKFPRVKVKKRYKEQGTLLLNTAEVGAIECNWDTEGNFVGCFGYRDKDWGRWHWQLSQ